MPNETGQSSKKVAVIVVNYNMPERADAIAEYLKQNISYPYDLYLVDNGSDQVPPAKHTTVFLKNNVQTCRGWLAGLEAADSNKVKYFAYWFVITSARFLEPNKDTLSLLMEKLQNDKNAVAVHPSLSTQSTTAWKHLKNRGTNCVRRTWMIDNIASLYRADWFNEIGRFDKELVYAWGIDLETCYLARQQGRSIWIDDRVLVEKISDIGYKMKRMGMSSTKRKQLARQNMLQILGKKYGKNCIDMMLDEKVERAWK